MCPETAKNFRPVAAVDALVLPPLRAALLDDRDRGEGLDGVHQRRLAPQAADAGERRLVARLAAMALHALDQRRLLAEDVAARRGEDVDLELAARVKDVGAEQPGRAGAVKLGAHGVLLDAVLVADEHPALLGADREHPQQHPLDHEVGLLGEDLAILEGAGLGLVGVADHELRLGLLGGHQLPLGAGREARRRPCRAARSP